MSERLLWLDGELVEAKPSLLQSLTPGVLKAKGVFETIRVDAGQAVWLESHLRRLSRGLKVLKLVSPVPICAIPAQITRLLKINQLKDACVRVMIWQRAGGVHSAIICQPLQPPTARQYLKGFKAKLTTGHRRQTAVPIKSLDYALFRRRLEQARVAGFDEALLLNRKGELVEGSRTNIFLVKDNCLLTPPVKSGCLPGVMRQAVWNRARRLKLHCAAKPLKARDLLEADEAFVTNALIGVMPLTRLGQKKIGTGKPGPTTLRLRKF